MFSDISSFSSFKQSMITLFGSGLGNFDYTVYDSITNFDPVVGYIFLTVYLLASTIMLINFLIAILSNTYGLLTLQNNALYLKEVIFLRQRYGYQRHYSSLVSAFVPLNLLSLVLFPLLSTWKSSKLNTVVLLIEYTVFGILSIIVYFLSILILSPLSYIVVLISKAKYIFKKPSFGCKDKCYRILDLFSFLIIGLFWLLFLCFYDTITYTVQLFRRDIRKVQEDNYQVIEKNNKNKDGSISKNLGVKEENKAKKNKKLDRIKNKSIGAIINPVKEGLSDTTLKIVKCTLSMLKKEMIKERKLDKTMKNLNSVCLFMNINLIMRRLYKWMYVQEHINQIWLGMHYKKKKTFFESKLFDKLIDEIKGYDDEDAKIEKKVEKTKNNRKNNLFNKLFNTESENKEIDFKNLFWRYKIQQFLYNSEQKWILDQYNLAKRFIIQNSIDIIEDSIIETNDFYQSNKFNSVPAPRNKSNSSNTNTKSSIKNDSSKANRRIDESKDSDEIKLMMSKSNIGESVKKVDINALLNTINEIEFYLPMKHILTDDNVDVNNLLHMTVTNKDDKKMQFSM